jgi:hypothetical protein
MLFDCLMPLVNIGRIIIHIEFRRGDVIWSESGVNPEQNYAALQGKKSFSGKKSLPIKSKCTYFFHQYKAVNWLQGLYRLYTNVIKKLKFGHLYPIVKFIFYSTGIFSSGSPNTYLLNHCQLCQMAASLSLGLLIPCPNPLYTMSLEGTFLSCRPRYSS